MGIFIFVHEGDMGQPTDTANDQPSAVAPSRSPPTTTRTPEAKPSLPASTNSLTALGKRSAPEHSAPRPAPEHNKRARVDKQNQSVASHYNARPDQGLQKRQFSPIFHLRNFNNWVKSILLKQYIDKAHRNPCRPRGHPFLALDLCCGKMGDLIKWSHGRVSFVLGADIALESLRDGKNRYEGGSRPFGFGLSLVHADCTTTDIHHKTLSSELLFDLTSCQFALHYGFDAEEQARMLLRNASSRLRKGGFFVGTIPNAKVLLEKVQKHGDGRRWVASGQICEVEFEEDVSELKVEDVGYGIKYKFTLKDAIDGCSEFLVPPHLLVKLGEEFGLKLRSTDRFPDFRHRSWTPENKGLWNRMKVEGLSDDECQVVDLYCIFVFEKTEGPTGTGSGDHTSRTPVNIVSL